MRYLGRVSALATSLALLAAPVVNASPNNNLSGDWKITNLKGAVLDHWTLAPNCTVLTLGCTTTVFGERFTGTAKWTPNGWWTMVVIGPVPICGNGGLANGVMAFTWDAKIYKGDVAVYGTGPCPSGQRTPQAQYPFIISPDF